MDVNSKQFDQQSYQQSSNKKTMLSIIGVAILVVGLVGITYAFFNYTRTGSVNTVRVGNIYFNTEQGAAINLTNMFPIDTRNGIPNDATKVGSVTIHVTGSTSYDEGVEYEVTAVNVQNAVNNKAVPISIDVSYTANGTGKTIGTADVDYYTNRATATTSIYKVVAGNVITEGEQLVVGYIAPGVTGIDGNIVIKAYLDDRKIAISDTYDADNPGTDNNGTTASWVNGRTVFTTNEWNSLQANGISFQIKVEANEDKWVEQKRVLYEIIEDNSNADDVNSTYVQNIGADSMSKARVQFLSANEGNYRVMRLSAGMDFTNPSSDTNGKGLYLRAGTENNEYPIYYYRGDVYDNNVAFAGFCWLIVRTTDTGGVKLLYNGVQDSNGTCLPLTSSNSNNGDNNDEGSDEVYDDNNNDYNNYYDADNDEVSSEVFSTKDEIIPIEGELATRRLGNQTVIATDEFSTIPITSNNGETTGGALASAGYMYGKVYSYEVKTDLDESTIKYGSSFTYENGIYTLTSMSNGVTNGKHYTCFNTTGVCDGDDEGKIYYITEHHTKGNTGNTTHYVELENGESIQDVIDELHNNTTNSNIKNVIDAWYAANMTSYTSKLEDTVYCNDRSVLDYRNYNPDGEMFYSEFNFSALGREYNGLTCPNKSDAFTVSDTINGNGALTYPVGLITTDELILAGYHHYENHNDGRIYVNAGKDYWTMTPASTSGMGNAYYQYASTRRYKDSRGELGIRPMISLKHGILVIGSGEGTAANPYVVK